MDNINLELSAFSPVYVHYTVYINYFRDTLSLQVER